MDTELILITPEILEKTGFRRYLMYWKMPIDNKDNWFEYYPFEHRLSLYNKGIDGLTNILFTCNCLFYAHELQMAFDLCKVSVKVKIN